jgi:hypothetical protein
MGSQADYQRVINTLYGTATGAIVSTPSAASLLATPQRNPTGTGQVTNVAGPGAGA